MSLRSLRPVRGASVAISSRLASRRDYRRLSAHAFVAASPSDSPRGCPRPTISRRLGYRARRSERCVPLLALWFGLGVAPVLRPGSSRLCRLGLAASILVFVHSYFVPEPCARRLTSWSGADPALLLRPHGFGTRTGSCGCLPQQPPPYTTRLHFASQSGLLGETSL